MGRHSPALNELTAKRRVGEGRKRALPVEMRQHDEQTQRKGQS